MKNLIMLLGLGLLGTSCITIQGPASKAKTSAAKVDIRSIGVAFDLFELDTGNFPDAISELYNNPNPKDEKWNGPYLKSGGPAILDPWRTEYQYTSTPEGYELNSAGPDKTFGTRDDISSKDL